MKEQVQPVTLLSIGDFARASSLSVSAIRFYADRGVLAPATTDPVTGYRYFAESQIVTAALVRDLRRIDMPLAEVIDVLDMPPASRDLAIAAQIRRLESQLDEARRVADDLGVVPRIDVSADDDGAAISLRASDLLQAIGQVVPIAGVDRQAPHLMCVQVEARDGAVRLVATDRYRLLIRDLVPTSGDRSFAIVVAAAALREWLTKLISTSTISLDVAAGELIAVADGLELRCPAIPTQFPDYQAVLDRAGDVVATVVVDRDQLASMLGPVLDQPSVVLTASNGSLSVAQDPSTVADAWAAVNPRFAAQATEHAVGAEVVVELGQPHEPVTFRSANDGTYTSKLMPVVRADAQERSS